VLAAYQASAAVDPRNFFPAKDGEITFNGQQYLAYKIYNRFPENVTVDTDDNGDRNSLQSFYLAAA
jgi:hypothetical protein